MSKVTEQILPKRSEAKLPDTLSDKGKHKVEQYGWPYFRAGILLVNGYGKFLLIREAKVKKVNCLVDGQETWVRSGEGKWNLPCGRLQPWETFWRAADREGMEESGFDFDMGNILHIGFRFDINNPYIIVIYHAENPYDISLTDPPDPEEIAAWGWFSYEEVEKLDADHQLRNPELVMTAIRNELHGISIPADAIEVYTSKFASE